MRDEVEWHIKIHDELTRRHRTGTGTQPPEIVRWTWERAGLALRVTAVPKKPEARGRSTVLFGNSLPVMAWYVGEPWGTL